MKNNTLSGAIPPSIGSLASLNTLCVRMCHASHHTD